MLFIAELRDETGCYFTIEVEAASRGEAWEYCYENYPESTPCAVSSLAELEADEREREEYFSDIDSQYYD